MGRRPKKINGIKVLKPEESSRVIFRNPDPSCPALRFHHNSNVVRESLKTGKFMHCVAVDYRPSREFSSSMWIQSCETCTGAVKKKHKKTGKVVYKVRARWMKNKKTGEKRLKEGYVGLV